MKFLCISLTLILSWSYSSAQNFTEKYFSNKSWFSDNKDSLFFKTDTLKWVLYKHAAPKWAVEKFVENPISFLGHGSYVKIELEDRGKMNLTKIFWETATIYVPDVWTWKFNQTSRLLEIYFKQQLISKLKPISEKEVQIKSRTDSNNLLTTSELTFIRVL